MKLILILAGSLGGLSLIGYWLRSTKTPITDIFIGFIEIFVNCFGSILECLGDILSGIAD